MKYCQGPKCHQYHTKDRIRGPKGEEMTRTEITVVVGFYIFLMVMFWIGGIR